MFQNKSRPEYSLSKEYSFTATLILGRSEYFFYILFTSTRPRDESGGGCARNTTAISVSLYMDEASASFRGQLFLRSCCVVVVRIWSLCMHRAAKGTGTCTQSHNTCARAAAADALFKALGQNQVLARTGRTDSERARPLPFSPKLLGRPRRPRLAGLAACRPIGISPGPSCAHACICMLGC